MITYGDGKHRVWLKRVELDDRNNRNSKPVFKKEFCYIDYSVNK